MVPKLGSCGDNIQFCFVLKAMREALPMLAASMLRSLSSQRNMQSLRSESDDTRTKAVLWMFGNVSHV
jgi:hypothetical protein